MGKAKKIGILFIVFGLFIPLVFYPFTELTDDAKKTQLLYLYRGEKYTPRLNGLVVYSVRYPYIVALGLIFIFVGISIIVLTGKKDSEKSKHKAPVSPSSHKSGNLSAKNAKKVMVVDESGAGVQMLECPQCGFSIKEEEFTESEFFCPKCNSRLEFGYKH